MAEPMQVLDYSTSLLCLLNVQLRHVHLPALKKCKAFVFFPLPSLSDSIIPLRPFLITSQTSDVISPALHLLGLLAWF